MIELLTLPKEQETAVSLPEITGQLVRVVARLEARLSALEESKDAVTILHKDALALSRAVRERADEIGARYGLDEKAVRTVRSAIKKDVLRQYSIRDLHDLPAKALPACRTAIRMWSSLSVIRAVMTTC